MQPHDMGLLELETPAAQVTPVGLYAGSDEVGQVVAVSARNLPSAQT